MGKSLIYSYKTAIVLLLIYALGLAIATFVEKYTGTQTAKTLIYYSPLFIFLQLLLVVNFIFSSIKHRLFEKGKWGFVLVHGAFIVILAGALTTHIFSKEGTVHLRENESSDRWITHTNKGETTHQLPFQLELKQFTMTRYPGSSSPSSFESDLIIHRGDQSFERKVSMNHILDLDGYRFFQSSYDKDEKGTVLSVNQDLAGRNITYTGYGILIMGFILCLTGKKSRFRQLAVQLKQIRNTSVLLLFLLPAFPLPAQNDPGKDLLAHIQKGQINSRHAAQFGALPMQSIEGRLEPVNTFSSEVLRKLHHSDKIGEFNSDQFLLSLLTRPEMWTYVPFITCSNPEIAFRFDLSEKQCAYYELFDSNGNYKLQDALDAIFRTPPAARSRLEKDLIKLDEQIHIFYQLINGEMINIFPVKDDPNHQWQASDDRMNEYLEAVLHALKSNDWNPADKALAAIRDYQEKNSDLAIASQKINAELRYNQLNVFSLCKRVYLIAGGLLLVFSFILLFRKSQKGVYSWISFGLIAMIAMALLYHLFGIGLRWYIAGYAPWSNAYETMIYVAFITVVAGILFVRKSTITFALASLFGGVILFVSGLNWMDPQITPLVPVLKSPWLMLHVAVIMAAYGFFGVSFLLGITNLVLSSFHRTNRHPLLSFRLRELTIINELSLWAGLILMTTGTFMGAIWANESWGRYWGWDPKETWALVTIVVYAIVTHLHLVKKWDNPRLFNLLSVLAFACVLMTYFGVNYLLSGMHSYR
ncbi:cytochrome c biogenesis protein [Bacteroidia bacterium]|nr:cytochrome c biogenesis protein [Bacteroidia bacterium]GHT49153.1 cytochrome c biogenesis protein [Bacteroidia bacterium]